MYFIFLWCKVSSFSLKIPCFEKIMLKFFYSTQKGMNFIYIYIHVCHIYTTHMYVSSAMFSLLFSLFFMALLMYLCRALLLSLLIPELSLWECKEWSQEWFQIICFCGWDNFAQLLRLSPVPIPPFVYCFFVSWHSHWGTCAFFSCHRKLISLLSVELDLSLTLAAVRRKSWIRPC